MKRLIVSLLATCALLSSASAKDWTWQAGGSETLTSEFLFRGAGLGKNGWITGLNAGATYKGWLSLDARFQNWTSMETKNPGGTNRTDYDLSVTAAPTKWPVSVGLGWIYYTGQLGGNLRELYTSVNATKLPFRAGVDVYWNYNLPWYFVDLHAGKTWALPKLGQRWSVDAGGDYGHIFGRGFDGMTNLTLNGSMIYQATGRVKVMPTFTIDVPGNAFGETRDWIPALSCTVSYNTKF